MTDPSANPPSATPPAGATPPATPPRFTLWGVVLDSRDPAGLASFYEQLLSWERRSDDDPTWVTSGPRGGAGRPGLSFQLEEVHRPPVWPASSTDQQMQVHLDIQVDDLETAGARAVELGARLAGFQPQDDVRVYLDPAGHPFCLFL